MIDAAHCDAQLDALARSAAISYGLAAMAADGRAAEALRQRKLVARRWRRTLKGGFAPLYWLTPDGLAAARRLPRNL